MTTNDDHNTGLTVRVAVLEHGLGLELPSYQTDGAAGLDLVAAVPEGEPVVLSPGARKLVPTGLTIALEDGFEAQIRPRSGLALKHGISVLNSPGTIDSDYRGEVGVILINHGDRDFEIGRGDRIAQMVFHTVVRARLDLVVSLDETERGAGGFGSTGGTTQEH